LLYFVFATGVSGSDVFCAVKTNFDGEVSHNKELYVQLTSCLSFGKTRKIS